MYTHFTAVVHQQVAADRRHRLLDRAERFRRGRTPAAPSPIRTTDSGSSVLPVRSSEPGVRIGRPDPIGPALVGQALVGQALVGPAIVGPAGGVATGAVERDRACAAA